MPSPRVVKMLSVKNSSPRVIFLALGENFFFLALGESLRVNFLALGEEFFTESFFFIENYFFTLGEELFAESPSFGYHQSLLLSAKALFPVVTST
jgi:hypothetical protein